MGMIAMIAVTSRLTSQLPMREKTVFSNFTGRPIHGAAATAEMNTGDPIAQMSDEEFAAFSRRAKEAALAGLKVHL